MDGDERRSWTDEESRQAKQFGAPVKHMHRGAYFSFPLDRGAVQLMVALGLVDEAMVMYSNGGRHKFPEDGFERGGLKSCEIR